VFVLLRQMKAVPKKTTPSITISLMRSDPPPVV
jgi:hypothetical protein